MPKNKSAAQPAVDPVKQVIALVEEIGSPVKMKQQEYREFLDALFEELQLLRAAARG